MNATKPRTRSTRSQTPYDAARARAANTHRRLGRLGIKTADQYALAARVTGSDAAAYSLAVLTPDQHAALIDEAERLAEAAAAPAPEAEPHQVREVRWTVAHDHENGRVSVFDLRVIVTEHGACDCPQAGRVTIGAIVTRAGEDIRYAIARTVSEASEAEARAWCEAAAALYVAREDESARWRREMTEDRAAGRPWRRATRPTVWRDGEAVAYDAATAEVAS